MKPAISPRRRWRVAAGVAVVLFFALIARFWHPVYGFTALFQLDASNDDLKLAAFRELPVFVHRDTGGYDGLYYAQIAQDPSLRDPGLPRAMDNFAYRARRILPPALAWVLGFGQPAGIIFAYSVLNLAAWLALAFVLWRLLAVNDARGWLAWAGVLFSAGALGSVRLALTDLVAVALLAAAFLAAEQWRGRLAVALCAAAGLARETALLAVVGLFKPKAERARANAALTPWLSAKNIARVILVAAPVAAWLGYVRWRVGPAEQGWANFTWPVAGFVEKWQAVFAALFTVEDKPLAWTTLLATFSLSAQAVFILAHPRVDDRWWRVGAAYVVMMLCLGTAVWEGFPGAATRVLLPLQLAFNVLVHRSRASIAWLIAGNLTVFAGLVALRDVPDDPREVATLHAGATAAIARIDEGWYGRETERRHTWFWTAQRGSVAFETWPKAECSLTFEFKLRAIRPCRIVVRQDGREVARFEARPQLESHRISPLRIAGGRASLEFSTDTPPTPEGSSAGARPLAFALYDPHLGVMKR